MKGIILACKYSWNCDNAVNYGLSKYLLNFISANKKNTDAANMKKILTLLDSYRFYLSSAEKNKLEDPFEDGIISGYWKGSPEMNGEIWHNYTTLIPILNMPIKFIDSKMIDKCMVHPARVTEIKGDSVLIEYRPVIKTKGGLAISKKTVKKEVKNFFNIAVKNDDYVTIHFEGVIEIITEQEVQVLDKITLKSFKRFNLERSKKGR